MKKQDSPLVTCSLHIAAACAAVGCKVTAKPLIDGRRCEFTVTPGTAARQTAAAYVTDELSLSPSKLFTEFETLRTTVRLALGREVKRGGAV